MWRFLGPKRQSRTQTISPVPPDDLFAYTPDMHSQIRPWTDEEWRALMRPVPHESPYATGPDGTRLWDYDP